MTRALYLLATWCARHAKLVLAMWIVALLAVSALNNRLPAAGVQEITLEGTDSAAGQTLLGRAFTGASAGAQPVVMACGTDLGTGSGAQTVKSTRQAILKVPGVLAVTGPVQQKSLLSDDKQTAILNVQVADAQLQEKSTGQQILNTAKESAPDCEVAIGGSMGEVLSQGQTSASEGIGLLFAIIVLLLVLRRFSAAFIPILSAIMSVGIGSAIVGLLGRLVFIPDAAPILGSMIGLGVGIDYALFLVVRHRTLLRKGYDVNDSIGRTAGTAGAGMVFAGTTLILAVAGLALTNIQFLAWLGYAAAVVIFIAILASLTLVPALFGLFKMRVLPKKQRDDIHHADEHLDKGFWARIADIVTSHPWPFAIGTTILLVLLALPITKMEFGQMDDSYKPPTTTAYQANALISEAFGPGYNGPLAVALQLNRPATPPKDLKLEAGSGDPRTKDERLTSLREVLEQTPGVAEVGKPIVSPDGGVAVIQVIPTTGPADPATQVLVTTLRDDVLPPAITGEDMDAHVAGLTAIMMDLSVQIGGSLPVFIGGVVLLSAFLLMMAYRSIVIPVKAAVMNLLSIAAAYGIVVMVFQFGWGASLIGLERLVPIETFVPMIMFAVLFGLSMDYEVFLLTAFQEHWHKTHNMVTAVRRGLADTGSVVTTAAAIMCVVFSSFIFLAPDALTKLFGVGLATAVFIDATIVRCLLVPALMVLAAKVTWWLPKWLDRALPHLQIEGDPQSLETIHQPPKDRTPRTVAEATTPTMPVIVAVVGVLIGWFIGARLVGDEGNVPYMAVAIAISAVVGGLIVWLPPGMPGAGPRPGARVLLMLLGGIGVAVVYAIIRAVIPYTNQNPGTMAAWALLAVVLVFVLTRLRRYGLPAVLGGIVMAVTIAVSGVGDTGLGSLMQIAILPALLSALMALLVMRVITLIRTPDEPEPTPEPEKELVEVGS